MTELNAIPDPKRPNVALLIDGENISAAFAGKIIVRAGREGTLVIRRVYGNATRIPAWDDAPGIRLVHTGTGKNAADIALTLEATELSFDAQIDTFVIVSSDGDFKPLATRLRERGFRVVGLGEEKAPDGFRKTCSDWETLVPKAKAPCKTAQTIPQTPPPDDPPDDHPGQPTQPTNRAGACRQRSERARVGTEHRLRD